MNYEYRKSSLQEIKKAICCPESGLLSDWAKNKRSFGALHRLVKQHIWLPVLLDRFFYLRLFMTETTR